LNSGFAYHLNKTFKQIASDLLPQGENFNTSGIPPVLQLNLSLTFLTALPASSFKVRFCHPNITCNLQSLQEVFSGKPFALIQLICIMHV